MKARVFVTLKPSVFDPQGRAIADALQSLGYAAVSAVRQGKYFELDVDAATPADAERLAAEIADRVLANPVIESFRIETGSAPSGADGIDRREPKEPVLSERSASKEPVLSERSESKGGSR